MRTDDKHVQEAFAVARAAYDEPELRAENERLRAALQDALDLAWEDAPAMMIVDVCDRALAASGKENRHA